MKDLLISHTDLDGISPIILYSLTGNKFDYKNIEIADIMDTFKELFDTNIKEYRNIYITDLSLPEEAYEMIDQSGLKNVKVFDHHKSHLFANIHDYVDVVIDYDGVQTCATEIFYKFLASQYKELNKPIIKDYVRMVRELDTYNFTSDMPKQLDSLRDTYGKTEFMKTIIRRLKGKKDKVEFTTFEKRLVKIQSAEIQRYMLKKEKKMFRLEINKKKCGVVFAETNKSELGNYLSNKYPELDLIVLIDASSRISYRTSRDDVDVAEFAEIYGGGGHKRASGSILTEEDQLAIIDYYFKNVKRISEN